MPIEEVPDANLTYFLVAFDADGNERAEADGSLLSRRALQELEVQPITDVFVMSHGWQGDIPGALQQYSLWLHAMAGQVQDRQRIQAARPQFRPLIIGLHWPSQPWGDEKLSEASPSFETARRPPMDTWIDDYARRIADTAAARAALATIYAAAHESSAPDTMTPAVRNAYEVLDREAAMGSQGLGARPGADRERFDPEGVFKSSKERAVGFALPSEDDILAPLRVLSFWKMKQCACDFGETGAFTLLCDLQRRAGTRDIRFHLMGHSFGCIVVSAALAGPRERGTLVKPIHSLSLVQGALSLWSYCQNIPSLPGQPGYFQSIIASHKVVGPVVTTQSEHDRAVGHWYPLAAGMYRQVVYMAKGFPKYGGVGAFGVQGPGLDVTNSPMLSINDSYAFQPGKVYNLESSPFICDGGGLSGAHSDIAKPEVAHAVWQAFL